MPYKNLEEGRQKKRAYYQANKWRYKNPDGSWKGHYDPVYDKKSKLRRRYNITLETFNKLLEEQSGICAICLNKPATDVDHDHITGQIRGLLCRGCNRWLGMVENLLTRPGFKTYWSKYKWRQPLLG